MCSQTSSEVPIALCMYSCADIDECALNQDNCNDNADCVNIPASFQCVCREGYEGSGTICTGINNVWVSYACTLANMCDGAAAQSSKI